jgi:transposase
MPISLRPRRDFAGLERRRKQAARLFAEGAVQADVARRLQASRQSVMRWYRQWRRGGVASLRAAGRAGRMPRLDARDLSRVDTALREGARAHGFNTDLWTLPRVARVIEQVTKVRYHPGHVWKILRSMEWTLQRPAKRARERDEEAVQRGVAGKWPALKKNARRQRAWILFQDESGISERPPVRRTWAPRGETPVLIHAFNWKKMSISAVLAYRWDGKRSRMFFQMRGGSYDAESLIRFLKDLRRHLRGRRAILIWDGLPAHRSRIMRDYLHTQRAWLKVERLPGYAPDLNPVETL